MFSSDETFIFIGTVFIFMSFRYQLGTSFKQMRLSIFYR